jgi:hypothetical protein
MFKYHFPTKCLPVIRMNQLVPLQKLFMLETFPTFVADKAPPIVMFCLLVINYRTGMIQHLPTYVTRVAFLNLLFLQKFENLKCKACQETDSKPAQVKSSQHTKYHCHTHFRYNYRLPPHQNTIHLAKIHYLFSLNAQHFNMLLSIL